MHVINEDEQGRGLQLNHSIGGLALVVGPQLGRQFPHLVSATDARSVKELDCENEDVVAVLWIHHTPGFHTETQLKCLPNNQSKKCLQRPHPPATPKLQRFFSFLFPLRPSLPAYLGLSELFGGWVILRYVD